MFNFFQKSRANLDLSELKVDMHSHLIPGIDDGAAQTEDSIQLIRGLIDLGFKELYTTPHIYGDLYPNTPSGIRSGLRSLEIGLAKALEHLHINAAAEYFLDDHFDQLLNQDKEMLTLGSNKWILVEFSFASMPMGLKERLFQLQMKGYQPILAHPERYEYFLRNKAVFADFKAAGYLFQVNLLSLAGYYGPVPMELAKYLIKNNFVDLLGTDLHHIRHLEALRKAGKIQPMVDKLLQSGRLLNHQLLQAKSTQKS